MVKCAGGAICENSAELKMQQEEAVNQLNVALKTNSSFFLLLLDLFSFKIG